MILKEYYLNQFYITLHCVKRNTAFSIILLLANLSILVFLLLSNEVIERIQRNDRNSFDSIRDSFHFNDTNNIWKQIVYGISVAYNFSLILLIAIEALLYQRRKSVKSEGFILYLISFMCKIYINLVFIPSLWSTMYNIPNTLSFVNMVFTLFFGIVIEIHDYDYCLSSLNNDKLSKYQLNQVQILKIILLFFTISNRTLVQLDVQDILCLIYSLFSFGSSLAYREYFNIQLRKFNFISQVLYLLIVIVSILLRNYEIKVNFIFFLIAFLPFCYKCIIYIERSYSDIEDSHFNLKTWLEKKNEKQILFYFQNICAQLDKFSSIDYFLNQNSCVLEKIASDHTKECKSKHICFCQTQKISLGNISRQSSSSSTVTENKNFDDEMNKKILLTHLDNYFKELKQINAKQKKISKLDFYYINFLIEQCRQRTNALYQIELINSQIQNQSIYFKIYMKYLVLKVKYSFQELDDRTQACTLGLIFEETLKKAQDLFEMCILLKLKLLSLLNSDYVDIQLFQQFGVQLYKQRVILKEKLQELARINSQNEVLKSLIFSYLENLAFIDTKQTIVNKKVIQKEQKVPIQYSQIKSLDSRSELNKSEENDCKTTKVYNPFDKNVCAIFLKLRNSDMGKIWRVQNSFSTIYGFQNPINQNINLIIPSAMHTIHNQKMKNFASQVNLKIGHIIKQPFAMANTIEGFGIPIQLEVSLDHITQFNEIGITLLTKVISTDSHFILIENNSRYLKTHIATKDFYIKFLESHFTVPEISQLEIVKIIPLLNYQIFDKSNCNITQTLAFLPSATPEGILNKNFFKHQSSSSRKAIQFDLDYYTNNANIDAYMVEYQLIMQNSDEFWCSILEIKKIQRIKKQKDISFELSLLKQNIDQLLSKQDIYDAFNGIDCDKTSHISNKPLKEYAKKNENQQTQTKCSYQIQSSDMLFNNILSPNNMSNQGFSSERLFSNIMSPNSTVLIESKKSPSYSSNSDFFSPSTSRRSNLINQLTDKAQDDYVSQLIAQNQSKQIDFNPFLYPKLSKQSKSQSVKQTQSITSLNGGEQIENGLNKQIFNQKIDEQDDIDEGSNYQFDLKNIQSIRQKRGTLETMTLVRDNSNSYYLGLITTAREQLIQNNQANPQKYQCKQYEQKNQTPDLAQLQKQEVDLVGQTERRRSYLQQFSQNEENKQNAQIIPGDYQQNNSSFLGNSSERQTNFKNSTKIRAQQSSVNSSQSSTKEVLKTLEKKIMSLKSSLGLRVLNVFGSFSVLIIVIMILIQFAEILKAFKKASIDYYFIQWPMEIASETTLINYHQLLIKMNKYHVFPAMTANWQDYEQTNMKQMENLRGSTWKLYIDQMNCDFNYSPYFQQLTIAQKNWIELKDSLSYPRVKENFKAGQSTFISTQISAYNSLFLFTSDSMNQEAILTENYDTYSDIIDTLKNDIIESAISSLESIQSKVELLMVLSITLSFCVIACILPINAYIQGQREEVLKLFSTIPNANIMRIATPCLNILQQINEFNHKNNSVKKTFKLNDDEQKNNTQSTMAFSRSNPISQNKNNIEIITQTAREIIMRSLEKSQKKKNISQTNSLPRYPAYLFLGGFVLFIFIIVLPVVNSLLAKKFKYEQITNINLLYSLYNLKDSFSETIFFTYSHIYGKFNLSQGGLYNKDFYQQRLTSYFKESTLLIQDMISEVSNSQQKQRYGNDDYESFFYPILQSDICKSLKENPQFTSNNKYNINLSICDNPKNYMLKKGFQTASKYFFSQLHQSFDTSNSDNGQNYQILIQQWQEEFDIKNFNEYFSIIMNIITTLKDFMEKKGNQYIDEMKLTEIILTVSQICLLLSVYYFGWISFYYKTSFQMNETRRLLSLIDIQIIMENSYILSFLNKIK